MKLKEIGKSLVFVKLISNECSFELILDRFFKLFESQSSVKIGLNCLKNCNFAPL